MSAKRTRTPESSPRPRGFKASGLHGCTLLMEEQHPRKERVDSVLSFSFCLGCRVPTHSDSCNQHKLKRVDTSTYGDNLGAATELAWTCKESMVEVWRAWGPSVTPSLRDSLRVRKSEGVLSVSLPWDQAFAHLLAQPIMSMCMINTYGQSLVMVGRVGGVPS